MSKLAELARQADEAAAELELQQVLQQQQQQQHSSTVHDTDQVGEAVDRWQSVYELRGLPTIITDDLPQLDEHYSTSSKRKKHSRKQSQPLEDGSCTFTETSLGFSQSESQRTKYRSESDEELRRQNAAKETEIKAIQKRQRMKYSSVLLGDFIAMSVDRPPLGVTFWMDEDELNAVVLAVHNEALMDRGVDRGDYLFMVNEHIVLHWYHHEILNLIRFYFERRRSSMLHVLFYKPCHSHGLGAGEPIIRLSSKIPTRLEFRDHCDRLRMQKEVKLAAQQQSLTKEGDLMMSSMSSIAREAASILEFGGKEDSLSYTASDENDESYLDTHGLNGYDRDPPPPLFVYDDYDGTKNKRKHRDSTANALDNDDEKDDSNDDDNSENAADLNPFGTDFTASSMPSILDMAPNPPRLLPYAAPTKHGCDIASLHVKPQLGAASDHQTVDVLLAKTKKRNTLRSSEMAFWNRRFGDAFFTRSHRSWMSQPDLDCLLSAKVFTYRFSSMHEFLFEMVEICRENHELVVNQMIERRKKRVAAMGGTSDSYDFNDRRSRKNTALSSFGHDIMATAVIEEEERIARASSAASIDSSTMMKNVVVTVEDYDTKGDTASDIGEEEGDEYEDEMEEPRPTPKVEAHLSDSFTTKKDSKNQSSKKPPKSLESVSRMKSDPSVAPSKSGLGKQYYTERLRDEVDSTPMPTMDEAKQRQSELIQIQTEFDRDWAEIDVEFTSLGLTDSFKLRFEREMRKKKEALLSAPVASAGAAGSAGVISVGPLIKRDESVMSFSSDLEDSPEVVESLLSPPTKSGGKVKSPTSYFGNTITSPMSGGRDRRLSLSHSQRVGQHLFDSSRELSKEMAAHEMFLESKEDYQPRKLKHSVVNSKRMDLFAACELLKPMVQDWGLLTEEEEMKIARDLTHLTTQRTTATSTSSDGSASMISSRSHILRVPLKEVCGSQQWLPGLKNPTTVEQPPAFSILRSVYLSLLEWLVWYVKMEGARSVKLLQRCAQYRPPHHPYFSIRNVLSQEIKIALESVYASLSTVSDREIELKADKLTVTVCHTIALDLARCLLKWLHFLESMYDKERIAVLDRIKVERPWMSAYEWSVDLCCFDIDHCRRLCFEHFEDVCSEFIVDKKQSLSILKLAEKEDALARERASILKVTALE